MAQQQLSLGLVSAAYGVLAVAGLALGVTVGSIIPSPRPTATPAPTPTASVVAPSVDFPTTPPTTPPTSRPPARRDPVAPIDDTDLETPPSAAPAPVPTRRASPPGGGDDDGLPPLRPTPTPPAVELPRVGSILGAWDWTDGSRAPAVFYFSGQEHRGKYVMSRAGTTVDKGYFRHHDGTLELTDLKATLAGKPDVLEAGDVGGWVDANHFEVKVSGGSRVASGEIASGRVYKFVRKP